MFTPRRRGSAGILVTLCHSPPASYGGGREGESNIDHLENFISEIILISFEAFPLRPCGPPPPSDGGGMNDQFRARSTALMAGVARSAAVMSARCFTSATSTSITMSKKSIERLTMRRFEMLPSWRAITVDRLDRLPGWLD